MNKRRVHSSIEKLPKALQESMTRMVVDGLWPADWSGKTDGRPRYENVVAYCESKGFKVSPSAIGRWAMRLQVFERMKSAGAIARDVMKDLTADSATATQKAAAEIMTAQIIEFASGDGLTAKEIGMVSGAIRDCTQVALKADQYIRSQIEKKAAAADKVITDISKKKNLDPETLRVIREQIYGIVK